MPHNKTDQIRIRILTREKAILELAAKRDGLSLSEWLRRLGLQAAGAPPMPPPPTTGQPGV